MEEVKKSGVESVNQHHCCHGYRDSEEPQHQHLEFKQETPKHTVTPPSSSINRFSDLYPEESSTCANASMYVFPGVQVNNLVKRRTNLEEQLTLSFLRPPVIFQGGRG